MAGGSFRNPGLHDHTQYMMREKEISAKNKGIGLNWHFVRSETYSYVFPPRSLFAF